jgi:hypothetical protein
MGLDQSQISNQFTLVGGRNMTYNDFLVIFTNWPTW